MNIQLAKGADYAPLYLSDNKHTHTHTKLWWEWSQLSPLCPKGVFKTDNNKLAISLKCTQRASAHASVHTKHLQNYHFYKLDCIQITKKIPPVQSTNTLTT